MNQVLADKIAVVAGAGRGIGRAIAEEFAAAGAKVIVASRSHGTVDEVVRAIQSKGGEAIGAVCDVSRKADVTAAVDRAVDTWGAVDILVNVAQSFGTRAHPELRSPNSPVESVTEEEWDWVYSTGLKGTLYAMQAAFPHLKARGGGSVINFGSARGLLSTPGTSAYNSTKEAIRGLSRTAANEWGVHNIRVNVINPVIDTDAYRADVPTAEAHQQLVAMIPLRRLGTPHECARVALFLAGPDSCYLTGMLFTVDGGLVSLP